MMKHEWLENVPAPQRDWWTTFTNGLHATKRELASELGEDKFIIKYKESGFLSIRFFDVGISNSEVSRRRHHVSLGREQPLGKGGPSPRQQRFWPIIDNWVSARSWGSPTNKPQSNYREQRVDALDCPSAEAVVSELAELLQQLKSQIHQ